MLEHGQAGQAHEGFVFAETSAQCEAYMQIKPHKQVQRVRGQDSDLVKGENIKVMQVIFFSLSLMSPFTQDGFLHWQELYEF